MTEETRTRTTREKPVSGWVLAAAFLVLIVIGLSTIYIINNRIPNNLVPPPPKMPVPNAWDDFVRAGTMLGMQGPVSSTQPRESWTIAELQAFEKSNAPALAVVRGALGKPYQSRAVRSFNTLFPEYARSREIARTLLSEAYYYRRTGQPRKAMDSMLDADELGAMTPKGATLIGALVGCAIQSIGISDMEIVIPQLNEAELAHAAKRMETIERKQVLYSDVILEEGYASTACSIEVLSQTRLPVVGGLPGSFGTPGSSSYLKTWNDVQFLFMDKPAMLRDNLRYYKALAKEQRGLYTGKSRVPMPKNMLARIMCLDKSTVMRGRVAVTRPLAMNAIIETEIALRRYNIANGRYPDRLDQLTPTYLKSVPIDPFGLGKPLRYKPLKNGKSFLLYSVGMDMVDDGGKPVNKKGYGTSQSGDLVAGKL